MVVEQPLRPDAPREDAAREDCRQGLHHYCRESNGRTREPPPRPDAPAAGRRDRAVPHERPERLVAHARPAHVAQHEARAVPERRRKRSAIWFTTLIHSRHVDTWGGRHPKSSARSDGLLSFPLDRHERKKRSGARSSDGEKRRALECSTHLSLGGAPVASWYQSFSGSTFTATTRPRVADSRSSSSSSGASRAERETRHTSFAGFASSTLSVWVCVGKKEPTKTEGLIHNRARVSWTHHAEGWSPPPPQRRKPRDVHSPSKGSTDVCIPPDTTLRSADMRLLARRA